MILRGWLKMADLIDRQAAIKAIDRLDIPEDMCVFEILSHIELEIGTLPSAQPEPCEDAVSRQQVLEEFAELFMICNETLPNENGHRYVVEKELLITQKHIEKLPSVTPKAEQTEIIRCKNCKYMTEHYDTDGNAPYWTCSEWDSGTDYDGFCHYAERREDDQR